LVHAAARLLLSLPDTRFSPVSQALSPDRLGRVPLVLRGVASDWPATTRWSFDYLAGLGGPQAVRLVVGNRETGKTHFAEGRLDEYLLSLEHGPQLEAADGPPPYLKEFDLLERIAGLRDDVRPSGLMPRRRLSSCSAWVGPRGAHTGLHYDYLDNIAVLLRGAKRFYLARPGTVERLGAASSKYDRWARLSSIGFADLAATQPQRDSLFVADLRAGDALYVPRGWWHEVINTEPSVLLSGFFGTYPSVIATWLWTGLQQQLHNARAFTCHTQCTCHASR
jgi:hypothetical protein